MAVIWGLDLKEMQWSKFGNSYMWNTDYHRRRTKFVVYQLAMICCVVSESLGTAALSKYVGQQDAIESRQGGSLSVYNDDFVGIASYNIFTGIYVATIFGAAFFFDLFWPERHESRVVRLAWRVCSVLACCMTLAGAVALTVIVATRSVQVSGRHREVASQSISESHNSPARYAKNKRALASVVFLWVGMLATIASTIIMWQTLARIEARGPYSRRGARARADTVQEKVVDAYGEGHGSVPVDEAFASTATNGQVGSTPQKNNDVLGNTSHGPSPPSQGPDQSV